ncbi:MAG: MBOAT family protein [Nitrospinaceae bacterium]|nr:MBOAT family protein [Nitrospinaceae bacterium]NIR56834.1 MBOAT family protein [Nitrospinaceae bacterium]NIS87301.1 MBOAT family protein [Nitrospinaceae bacterium]NIT84154.1 MBOAT family protein [Nitrospinaceae bacterium]NIU46341.1 MBOAT family protein [Nitrospinaceae bacterium]
MLFNSLTFIVFFIVVLGLHYTIQSWTARKTVLLLASYVFYAAWNPPFVVLLWISTLIDWFVARALVKEEVRRRRRVLLSLSLAGNLGLLGYFKYGGFLLENFIEMMHLAGIPFEAAAPNIILPVGISFYTFQTLSYTLDVYFKKARPSGSFLDFALYVTFFPQLVAGPIVRATEFLPQCEEPKRATRDQLGWGLYFITLGLFQKVVLADGFLSGASDAVFDFKDGTLFVLDAWLGLLAFSAQIFCDFAGYSTCAIGVALCLGFVLPDNFRSPYAAIGLSDFWRRWHMTLSSWLRDYLYISLGGNRQGHLRTLGNLMVTMFLGGLWHGASWTFVAWGVLHGFYLVVEHQLRQWFGSHRWTRIPLARVGLGFLTFFLVTLAWVFFRSSDFPAAWALLGALFDGSAGGTQILSTLDMIKVGLVVAGILGAHWYLHEKRLEHAMQNFHAGFVVGIWVIMLCGLILMQGGANAFIYFQF